MPWVNSAAMSPPDAPARHHRLGQDDRRRPGRRRSRRRPRRSRCPAARLPRRLVQRARHVPVALPLVEVGHDLALGEGAAQVGERQALLGAVRVGRRGRPHAPTVVDTRVRFNGCPRPAGSPAGHTGSATSRESAAGRPRGPGGAEGVVAEDAQGHPHHGEAHPSGGGHLLVEHRQPEGELQQRCDVLQQAQDAEGDADRGRAEGQQRQRRHHARGRHRQRVAPRRRCRTGRSPARTRSTGRPTAGSARNEVSTVRLATASTPASFFARPYMPNENASTSAIHGGRPNPAVRMSTATRRDRDRGPLQAGAAVRP